MELRITAFKGSPWQCGNTHEAVLEVRGRNAEPDKLLGAHLVWKTQTGRVIRGKVVKRHGHLAGNKLVARFHRGLPGQSLGTTVEVRAAKGAKAEKRVAVVAARRPARPSGPIASSPGPSGKKGAGTSLGKQTAARPAGPKAPKLFFTVESEGQLELTDTQFDAPGKDKGKGLTGEFVELTNKGSEPADLTGWSVKDLKDHVYAFPDGFSLAPGASVKVRTGKGKDSARDLHWGRGAAVWNNDGDKASLLDPQGKVQATRAWRPE